MRFQRSAMLVSILWLLIPDMPAHTETVHCESDEVQTGEDATSITCTKKTEIACIAAAGVALSNDRKSCVDGVFFLCDGMDKPDSALDENAQCVKSCIDHIAGGVDNLSSCSRDCIADLFTSQVQRRACDLKLNSCWERALQDHRNKISECKAD